MNAAIYQHDTNGGTITITKGQWPILYTKSNILGIFGEFSIIDLVGGFFFPFVLFMLMPIIMSMVMYEKEYRLREVMKMMGLKMDVYWLVTYLLFLSEYCLLCFVFWLFGALAQINFFTLHSPIVIFLYLFIWGNNLIAFSMLLTVFFEKTRTAVAIGFLLIFGFVFGGYMVRFHAIFFKTVLIKTNLLLRTFHFFF